MTSIAVDSIQALTNVRMTYKDICVLLKVRQWKKSSRRGQPGLLPGYSILLEHELECGFHG